MVLSNSATIALNPASSLTAPVSNPQASAPDSVTMRSMCRPMLSRRQPSSRIMRSVWAPVMAARKPLVDSSARKASTDEYSSACWPFIPAFLNVSQRVKKSASARTITCHCSCDSRSRTADDALLRACRLKPTLAVCSVSASPAIKERSNTRRAWVAGGTVSSTSALLTAISVSQASSGCEDWSSPPRLCRVSCASRTEFSARSV